MKYRYLLPPAAGAATALLVLALPTGAEQPATETIAERQGTPDESLGATLYASQCAACHGERGEGVEDRGPSLDQEGPASVDFVLRTGRMPLAAPNAQARRGPVRYTEEEIVALVDYAGAFGSGPEIPDIDIATGDLGNGGELYRLNCAACHVTSGAGAAIGGGREAPSLMSSSPTEIGEAVLVGPGAMPTFQSSFTPQDIDDVASYIDDLQRRETTSPDNFGGAGPVAEGLAAWLLALIPLIAVTRWIGTPHEGRDAHAVALPDTDDPEATS